MYDRDFDTWTDVPTNVNSVCGGWARLANGQVGLFAGHYATLDVYQVIPVWGPLPFTFAADYRARYFKLCPENMTCMGRSPVMIKHANSYGGCWQSARLQDANSSPGLS